MTEISIHEYCLASQAFAYIEQSLGLTRFQVTSASRERPLVRSRALFTWIMRNHSGDPPASYPVIGKLAGGRDHTTMIHSADWAETRIERDARFAELCAGFAAFEKEHEGEAA